MRLDQGRSLKSLSRRLVAQKLQQELIHPSEVLGGNFFFNHSKGTFQEDRSLRKLDSRVAHSELQTHQGTDQISPLPAHLFPFSLEHGENERTSPHICQR